MTESSDISLLRLGTSSFTAEGWEDTFYPKGTPARDFLAYYATQFDTLEIDSTFYRIPALSTVKGWYNKTPAHFLFALKVPQVITHERVLVGAEEVFHEFLRVTDGLGEKRAVLLLQFPYFNNKTFANAGEFLARLRPFLEQLPSEPRFAVEIRNKTWLGEPLLELLGKHKVAFALIDHPWMPRPGELLAKFAAITADFTYIRWLGDRKGIEAETTRWDKTIVDRSSDLEEWVEACKNFLKRKIRVFAFANNHYAGHAPDTLRMFQKMMGKQVVSRARPAAERKQASLFPTDSVD